MKQLGLTFVCLMVACFLGCGPRGPSLGQVEGTVTLDSVPLPGATVIFTPVDGGPASMAKTDGQGYYSLESAGGKRGAVVGKHKVSISTYEAGETDDSGQLVGHVPERVPAKYNRETTLEREVKRGRNVINFELQSH